MNKIKLPKVSNVSNPMAVGSQNTVKLPKAKSMPNGFGKPSLFFKSEEIKSSSVRKLHDFLNSRNKNSNKIK